MTTMKHFIYIISLGLLCYCSLFNNYDLMNIDNLIIMIVSNNKVYNNNNNISISINNNRYYSNNNNNNIDNIKLDMLNKDCHNYISNYINLGSISKIRDKDSNFNQYFFEKFKNSVLLIAFQDFFTDKFSVKKNLLIFE